MTREERLQALVRREQERWFESTGFTLRDTDMREYLGVDPADYFADELDAAAAAVEEVDVPCCTPMDAAHTLPNGHSVFCRAEMTKEKA
ncbi:hypothetical protein GCM10010399_63790 [Dactylosporangium fulvum]|uniref:Uncharacterized protein n=1 Tax=Dactylosporangium fulvum TaxID=53359 RepID=A0ABY5WAS3_9ACTN|nr:hypothetical protein [Dactylosporangium fulvum]UWP85798.1 hypothetical protein Dfulv_16760 [Dactylosporangium fulvum]